MKLSSDETKILAAKLLAQLLTLENDESSANHSENSEILAKLEEMNRRLVKIEHNIAAAPASQTDRADYLKPVFPVFLHSSQERFAVEEDVSQNEKACRFEPGGKPCDHCAMCSSRGF